MDFNELIAKLREALDIAEELNEQQLNEMALINGKIEVNNEDVVNINGETNEKFAHFHWVYKRKVHFKFSNRIPKNISELKKLFAFEDDSKLINDKELINVLKDLKSIVPNGTYSGKTTFDAAKEHWATLHPTRDITTEEINLD